MNVVPPVLHPGRWRVQTRLALAGFLLAVPSLVAGFLLLEVAAGRPDDGAERMANNVADVPAARLDEALGGVVKILVAASAFPEVQQMNRRAGEPLLQVLSAASPYVARIAVADRDGTVRLDSTAVDADGTVPASIRNRDYFHAVMATGWSGLEPQASAHGAPGFLVAVPLRDQAQQIIGVVTAELRTGEIARLLGEAVHRRGVGLLLIGADARPLLAVNWPQEHQGHQQAVATAQVPAASGGASPFISTSLTEFPLRLLISYPRESRLGPLGSRAARVAALAWTTLAALALVIMLSQRLTRPLTELVAQVSVLWASTGPAAEERGEDETAILARAFVELAGRLEQREQELQQRGEQADRQTRRLTALAREAQEAREAERKRIALELHDTVARELSGALFTLQDGSVETCSPAVQQACLILRQAHTDIHRTIFTIRPPGLGGAGLVGALRGLMHAFRADFNGTARLTCRGVVRRLAPEVEMAVYRAVQEGMRNVMSHSGARRVTLALAYRPDGLCITLRDDGKGFDAGRVDAVPAEHLGILGMRQRLEDFGGRLIVDSTPGAGTALTFFAPANLYVSEAAPVLAPST